MLGDYANKKNQFVFGNTLVFSIAVFSSFNYLYNSFLNLQFKTSDTFIPIVSFILTVIIVEFSEKDSILEKILTYWRAKATIKLKNEGIFYDYLDLSDDLKGEIDKIDNNFIILAQKFFQYLSLTLLLSIALLIEFLIKANTIDLFVLISLIIVNIGLLSFNLSNMEKYMFRDLPKVYKKHGD